MPKPWIICRANGYMGRLIAEEAVRRELQPVLAGRNVQAIKALAARLKLEHLTFDLTNEKETSNALSECDLVLNCAGPFTQTVELMLTACLKAKTHYLDISGELQVFEYCCQ